MIFVTKTVTHLNVNLARRMMTSLIDRWSVSQVAAMI